MAASIAGTPQIPVCSCPAIPASKTTPGTERAPRGEGWVLLKIFKKKKNSRARTTNKQRREGYIVTSEGAAREKGGFIENTAHNREAT